MAAVFSLVSNSYDDVFNVTVEVVAYKKEKAENVGRRYLKRGIYLSWDLEDILLIPPM